MSHLTPQSPSLSGRTRHTVPVTGAWLFGGAVAAGLGLGALAALATLLWITSPYPDSGPDGALHIAADMWLLAHGAPLLRTGTLSGEPAPVGLTPLLTAVLPVWLLARAAQHGLGERDVRGDGRSAAAVAGWVCGGYLLVGALVVLYTSDGPLYPDAAGAAVHLPLVAGCVTAAAVWNECGRPIPPAPLWPGRSGRTPAGRERAGGRALAALRITGLTTAVLCAAGTLLVTGSMVRNAGAAVDAFPQLASSWSGRFAVLLLALALLPNAAVWGAAWGLGPGFTLGGDSAVTPLGASGYPQLPDFPLFAGLPAEGPGGPLTWAVAGAVPLAAGVVAGCCAARSAVPVPHVRNGADSRSGTAGTVLLAALGCGTAVLLLVTVGSGSMGTGTLARFGPDPWLTGAAAAAWTALIGVPVALAARAWRLRGAARTEAAGSSFGVPGARAAVPAPAKKRRSPQDDTRRDGTPSLAARLFRRRTGGEADTGGDTGKEENTGNAAGKSSAGTETWHAPAARRARWAALKETSEGRMTEFGPLSGAGPRPETLSEPDTTPDRPAGGEDPAG